jgi:3-hydroxyacyl-[acyl-carrier-protein] dehydratase
VVELEAGVAATGELSITAGGYFPPLLLVEAMAQLGGIAAGQAGGGSGVLAALRAVKLPSAVGPGARLTVRCRVTKVFGRLVQVEGEVKESGDVIACAKLTLAVEGNIKSVSRRERREHRENPTARQDSGLTPKL